MKTQTNLESHIQSSTPLNPSIQAWEIFLQDQNKSPFTVKAFVNDLQLLANFIPPDWINNY